MADSEMKEVPEQEEVAEASEAEEPEAKEPEAEEPEAEEPEAKEPEAKEEGKEEEEPKVEEEEEAPATTENGDKEEETTVDGAAGEDEKEKEPAKESQEEGHGTAVAKHYNEHPENTREERKKSQIFYLRNFNNWVKSVMINEALNKIRKKNSGKISVLDLACGKGGDLLKWQKGRVSNIVCADIAEVSIQQCEQRYKDMHKPRNSRRYQEPTFDAQFITADCTKEDLSEKYNDKNKDIMFDLTSCQFAIHYSFESQEQAEKMLQNACEKLKPGGYFIGTLPCANEVVRRLRECEDLSFGNNVYNVSFTEKEQFPLFGHKYDFQLDGVVDCPEFLVHFPMLAKMAEKFDMKLELTSGFHDFFHDHLEDYKGLMYKMQALETYPPRREHDKLISSQEDGYSEAKDFLDGTKSGTEKKEPSNPKYRDHRNKDANHVGTLSKDEWEAAGLYMVFVFKKEEPEVATEQEKTAEAEKSEEGAAETEEKKEDDEVEKKDDDEVEKKDDDEVEKKDDDEVEKKDDDEVEKKDDDEVEKKDDDEVEKKDEKEEEKADAAKAGDTGDDEKVDEAKLGESEKKEEEEAQGETAEDEKMEEETAGEETKVTTPQRGTRKRRSAASKDETTKEDDTKEEEAKPKRETRKRKSTGGASADEEPPEKKKA